MTRPGEWFVSDQPVEINPGRRTCKLKVRNTGDRPIQIGSHYHFFEVNRALDFDRPEALGMHLNIPGGLDVRFEPGDEKEVELVEYGGTKRIIGFNNLIDGSLSSQWTVKQALERARNLEFKGMENAKPDAAGIVQRQGKGAQGGAQGSQSTGSGTDQDNKNESKQERKS